MPEQTATTNENKAPVEPGKGVDVKGCGRWLGYCGHKGASNQAPVTLSGTCACGKSFNITCSRAGCTGRNFHC